MCITKENVLYAFEKLENAKNNTTLPTWEQLPSIELYMDQVIILLNQYINPSAPITQSMINNYVKLKVVPAPVKKRYGKIHLAYLIIFCTLKQTLSLSTIQKIMPVDLSEEQVIEVYASFIENRQKAIEYDFKKTKEFSKNDDTINIILQSSSIANVFKILTEDIAFEKDEKKE
mgnify:CR=1 FL=1